MVFIKRVNNNDQGDSTHWGGDHNDTLDKYFDDVDIEGTTGKPAKINTKTEFRDNKLYLWNGANTFKYNIRPGTLTQDVELSLPTISANGTLLSTGGANDWTALQTFRNTLLAIRNPTNTASYIHNTSAIVANRNVTWPLLTADDTIAFNNFPADFQGKTVNIDQNTLKHSTTNAEGDVLIYDTTNGRYIRLAGGTDGQVLTRVSGDTAWATGGGGGGSQTPEVGNRVTGVWYPSNATSADGLWSGFLTNISTVTPDYTPGLSLQTSGRLFLVYVLNSADAIAGFKTNDLHFCRISDPELWVRYAITSTSALDMDFRLYIGFISDMSTDFTVNNPLTNKSGFVWFKEMGDSDIRVGMNDGDGTEDEDSTVSLSGNQANVHTIHITGDNANNRFGISLDGGAITYYTSEIPAASTPLGTVVQFVNEDAVTRNFYLLGAYFKATII